MADRGWSELTSMATLESISSDGASTGRGTGRSTALIRYVRKTEWVWVFEHFRHEFGADPSRVRGEAKADGSPKKEDSRIDLINRLLHEARGSGMHKSFIDRYLDEYPYLLGSHEYGASTGRGTGLAHAGAQDQDQDQDQDQIEEAALAAGDNGQPEKIPTARFKGVGHLSFPTELLRLVPDFQERWGDSRHLRRLSKRVDLGVEQLQIDECLVYAKEHGAKAMLDGLKQATLGGWQNLCLKPPAGRKKPEGAEWKMEAGV